MNKIVILTIVGLLAVLGIWGVSTYINISNTEIRMRKSVEAQNQVCMSFYDKLWKIISQKAQVADKYKSSFREVYADIMSERYSDNGGSLMKWIQEHNPDFDASLFKDIQRSIEVERNGYFNEEKKLIDLDNEHDMYIAVFPNSFFVGGRGETEIKTVRSSRTNDAFETGEDNDVDVF